MKGRGCLKKIKKQLLSILVHGPFTFHARLSITSDYLGV